MNWERAYLAFRSRLSRQVAETLRKWGEKPPETLVGLCPRTIPHVKGKWVIHK